MRRNQGKRRATRASRGPTPTPAPRGGAATTGRASAAEAAGPRRHGRPSGAGRPGPTRRPPRARGRRTPTRPVAGPPSPPAPAVHVEAGGRRTGRTTAARRWPTSSRTAREPAPGAGRATGAGRRTGAGSTDRTAGTLAEATAAAPAGRRPPAGRATPDLASSWPPTQPLTASAAPNRRPASAPRRRPEPVTGDDRTGPTCAEPERSGRPGAGPGPAGCRARRRGRTQLAGHPGRPGPGPRRPDRELAVLADRRGARRGRQRLAHAGDPRPPRRPARPGRRPPREAAGRSRARRAGRRPACSRWSPWAWSRRSSPGSARSRSGWPSATATRAPRPSTRCTGDGVTQRCVGSFAAADGALHGRRVTLLGVDAAARPPGAPRRPGWSARTAGRPTSARTGPLLHLRWVLGFVLVLLCGLRHRRADRGAAAGDRAGPGAAPCCSAWPARCCCWSASWPRVLT